MNIETNKIMDLRFLSKFTGGDKVKMERYINMFIRFIPAHLEKMEKCVHEKNWEGCFICANLMKAQMVYMGIRSQENLEMIVENLKFKKPSSSKLKEFLNGLRINLNLAMEELKEEGNALST